MCFSDKESHSEHYVKVGLGNKTSRGPGSPVESTLRISTQQRRTLPRTFSRAHLSSNPVLLSSHSLAPCLQQVTSSLCQQAHTCVCVQYQPSEDIQGRTRAKALPSPTIQPGRNHRSGSSSRPPQPSWPVVGAGWQARQGAQRADATVMAGPTRQVSHGAARRQTKSCRGELYEDERGRDRIWLVWFYSVDEFLFLIELCAMSICVFSFKILQI